jgi:hypothetical protein
MLLEPDLAVNQWAGQMNRGDNAIPKILRILSTAKELATGGI